MFVSLTQMTSADIGNKLNILTNISKEVERYFKTKSYGEDLMNLYIGVICVAPKFDEFFKPKRPNYKKEKKTFIDHGVMVESPPNCLTYDLKLEYQTYKLQSDVKLILADDILKSLSVIGTVKKIKDFNFPSFRNDFEAFFQRDGWL